MLEVWVLASQVRGSGVWDVGFGVGRVGTGCRV